MSGPWIDYATERPTREGVFEWRLPHVELPGMYVTFHAHMRTRGAGYYDVISPTFDYWCGYRVNVPKDTQWRNGDPAVACKWHEYANLAVEGLTFGRCIYCDKIPRLFAVQCGNGGGVTIGGDPHRFNSWWLECCIWGKTPHLRDPREIERIRRAGVAKASEELLEALIALYAVARVDRDEDYVAIMNAAAVIHKATGRA